jgi:hypothetical protein
LEELNNPQPNKKIANLPKSIEQKARDIEEARQREYEKAEQCQDWIAAKKQWKETHPDETLKEYKRKYIRGLIDKLPWEELIEEQANNEHNNDHNPSGQTIQ